MAPEVTTRLTVATATSMQAIYLKALSNVFSEMR